MRNIFDRLCKRLAYEAYFTGGPFGLASGGTSDVLIDCSQVLRQGDIMRTVATLFEPVIRTADAVGGPSLGADPMAAALAMQFDLRWFSVRKEPKQRGRETGAITGPVRPGDRVAIVEDVVTTGASLARAVAACRAAELNVVSIGILVARTDVAPIAKAYDAMGVNVLCFYTLAMLAAARMGE